MAARRSGIGGFVLGNSLPATGPDRRSTDRIDARIQATLRLAELPEATPAVVRLVDISDTGVRLESRRRVPQGARVVLDLECELPLRVHLGYDADSLVVDGPMHTHLVRVAGSVVRSERHSPRKWHVAIELCPDSSRYEELQAVRYYVDHLREQESSI